jgi:hypothetical protein
MSHRFYSQSVVLAVTVLLTSAAASHAQIVWNPLLTGAITGPSDIDTLGTPVDALTPHSITLFGAGSQSSGTLTVGDTTFNVGSASDSHISVSGAFDGGDGNGPDGLNAYETAGQEPTPPMSTDAYNYDELMTHNAASDNSGGVPSTVTVSLSGLTAGQTYDVQIWNATGRQTTYTSDLAVGSSSITLPGGDYAIGQFFATGSTASFTYIASGGSNTYGVISDIAIRAVPEPSTYAMIGLGALVLAWRLRRKLA